MKILCSLGFILLLPLVVHQNEILTTALLFGSRMFVMSSSNAVVIYSREVNIKTFFFFTLLILFVASYAADWT